MEILTNLSMDGVVCVFNTKSWLAFIDHICNYKYIIQFRL